MSLENIFEAQPKPTNLNLGRRKFVKTLAVLAGMTVSAEVLAACGDATNTPGAVTSAAAVATTAPAMTTTTSVAAATSTTATTTTNAVAATSTAAMTSAAVTTAAAGSATTSGATTTAAGASGGSAPAGYTQVGPVSSYKADTDPVAFTVSATKGYVFNKGGNYFVFSNVCTHKACPVPYVAADGKFECPCHGSQYDKTGEVLKGPAPMRLPKFEYKVVGDTLYAKIS